MMDNSAQTQISGTHTETGAYTGITAMPRLPVEVIRLTKKDKKVSAPWVDQMDRIQTSKDAKAFAELFAHFAPRVKSFLLKSGAPSGMADDIMQEAMAIVWQKAHLFDPSRASVSTWIFTIARNRKIDVLRKQNRPEPEDLPWGPEAPPDQADVMALQQETDILTAALDKLPDKQKDLVKRAYFGDLSHSEIAAETGLPLGTIKSRLRLALDRLRHGMTSND